MALGAAAIVASGLSGTGSASADPVKMTVKYVCDFPQAGKVPVTANYATGVPAEVTTGTPTAVDVETTLAISGKALAKLGATVSVSGTAAPAAQGGATNVPIPVDLAETEVKTDGGTTEIKGSGTAQPVFLAAGDGKVDAGTLMLKTRATGEVPCAVAAGQKTTLAAFKVTGEAKPDATAPTAPGKPKVEERDLTSISLSWAASTDDVGVVGYDVYDGEAKVVSVKQNSVTVGGLKAATQHVFTIRARDAAGNVSDSSEALIAQTAESDSAPKDCGKFRTPPKTDQWGSRKRASCVYMAGYSNVRKLNAATALNDPAEGEPVHANVFVYGIGNTIQADVEFAGPMTSTAKMLQFSFMPVKARMELTQLGHSTLKISGSPGKYKLRTDVKMTIRLFDASVNGTKLDVGRKCRTVEPATITLTGGSPEYKGVQLGGPLYGVYEIPKFTGCGVGEDLDSLLSGAISGPGNYLKIIQGPLCIYTTQHCVRPKPMR
ncbi:fibronectin type III domain-containing protein [Actinomadura macrotermitis]|nr:fibronectin type III domain-containing protein [Actinomadura macrotermitis]